VETGVVFLELGADMEEEEVVEEVVEEEEGRFLRK